MRSKIARDPIEKVEDPLSRQRVGDGDAFGERARDAVLRRHFVDQRPVPRVVLEKHLDVICGAAVRELSEDRPDLVLFAESLGEIEAGRGRPGVRRVFGESNRGAPDRGEERLFEWGRFQSRGPQEKRPVENGGGARGAKRDRPLEDVRKIRGSQLGQRLRVGPGERGELPAFARVLERGDWESRRTESRAPQLLQGAL
jgi:hypothetical protein